MKKMFFNLNSITQFEEGKYLTHADQSWKDTVKQMTETVSPFFFFLLVFFLFVFFSNFEIFPLSNQGEGW